MKLSRVHILMCTLIIIVLSAIIYVTGNNVKNNIQCTLNAIKRKDDPNDGVTILTAIVHSKRMPFITLFSL